MDAPGCMTVFCTIECVIFDLYIGYGIKDLVLARNTAMLYIIQYQTTICIDLKKQQMSLTSVCIQPNNEPTTGTIFANE